MQREAQVELKEVEQAAAAALRAGAMAGDRVREIQESAKLRIEKARAEAEKVRMFFKILGPANTIFKDPYGEGFGRGS